MVKQMGKAKIILFSAIIIASSIWLIAIYKSQKKEIEQLNSTKIFLSNELVSVRHKADSLRGIGFYAKELIIDTILYVDTVTVYDSIPQVDTFYSYLAQEWASIRIDTNKIIKNENEEFKINVSGKLFLDAEKAKYNRLIIYPSDWVIYDKKESSLPNINFDSKVGLGIFSHNISIGAYLRYKEYRFGVSKNLLKNNFGVYMGYELINF